MVEIHKTRKPYILDDTEPFMVRSENIHENPEKAFVEAEEVEEGNDFTIETCEECPHEEYLVKARKTKKRYVCLDKAPYITAGQNCDNHEDLTIRVEIIDELDGLFREDGTFQNITHVSTNHWGGAYIDEVYSVSGAHVTLRKTIQQNEHPWIHPRCYLVPALQNHVVSAATLISKLLGGAEPAVKPGTKIVFPTECRDRDIYKKLACTANRKSMKSETNTGSMGSSSGMFKDWAAARRGCGAGNSQPGVMARKGSVEGYKNILAEEFNIAWEVIKRNNYLFSDRELAELCMTVSGTIIARKESENRKVTTLPSRADNNGLINALFEEGMRLRMVVMKLENVSEFRLKTTL